MGNVCTISIPMDDCINCTARHAKYVGELEENTTALSTELEELKRIRNDTKRRVEIAEQQQHMKRLEQVQGWLLRVEGFEAQVEKLLADAQQRMSHKCLGGPGNCISRYGLGKNVAKKLEEVNVLKTKGTFEMVADKLPLASGWGDERPSEPTVGLESTLDEACNYIGDEQVGVIGIYGMGGIGKTTLLTQINNKLCNTGQGFNVVIWVTVSKNPNLAKVQDAIGERIGFNGETWTRKSQEDKAIDIFRVLKRKKFILLLDDLWDRFDLKKMGVPIPDKQNKSKVVFTTRSKDVCGRMGVHRKIEVKCLTWEKAWDLFQQKVGEDTLKAHREIPELAKIVAKECSGLPLVVITIGRAMACKNSPQEWHHAIAVLKKSAAEFSVMSQHTSSCASTTSSQAKSATSKGRGENKLLHVYARTEPGPVDVVDGIPCGKEFGKSSAKTFWSWCTICLRRHNRYPLDLAHDWRNIPDSFKENLWNEMAQKWIMEPVNREYFYSHAGKLWKDIKHHYRMNFFNNLPEGVDPLQRRPHNIPDGPQWPFLVKYWQGERWKENASKHKTARASKSRSYHHMGSTGYPALSHSLRKEACEKGESVPDGFDIWLAGVKDKKGNVDEEARRIIEIFEAKCVEFTSSHSASEEGGSEGSTTTTLTPRERAWDYILYEHKKCANHGFVLGMGSSITLPLLSGGKSKRSRSNVEMQLATKLKELEEKLDSTQAALKKQEEIVSRQQQTLSQQEENATQQAAMLQELMGLLTQQRQGGGSNQSPDRSG